MSTDWDWDDALRDQCRALQIAAELGWADIREEGIHDALVWTGIPPRSYLFEKKPLKLMAGNRSVIPPYGQYSPLGKRFTLPLLAGRALSEKAEELLAPFIEILEGS